MKKTTLILSSLVVFFSACKKVDNVTNPTNPTSTPSAVTPTPGNVSGALISLQANYNYTNPQLPIPVDLKFETGLAVFFSSPGSSTHVDAGTVSVNSTNLDNSSNTYSKTVLESQAAAMLSFDGGSSWNVAGAGSVAGFTYNHTTAFPSYTGTLPTTVTKASGLTVSISSFTSSADSVIVVLAAGSSSLTKTVVSSASSVTFTASELSGFPTVTDNTGIIQVDPWKATIVNKNGKDYAFIKEQANIGNININ